ncbi:MAG: anhydro-N-acetylmuramic acid kinase, partial [Pseudomonadota bacterium]
MAEAFVGLMSGTSLDGVDAVLAVAGDGGALQGAGHVHQPFDPALRGELLALNRSGADELHRAALATNALMRSY